MKRRAFLKGASLLAAASLGPALAAGADKKGRQASGAKGLPGGADNPPCLPGITIKNIF